MWKIIHNLQKQKTSPTHSPSSTWCVETSHLKGLLLPPVCMFLLKPEYWVVCRSVRQSSWSETKLVSPRYFFSLCSQARCFYCAHYWSHVFCQPQLYSWRPKEEDCSWEQWEFRWNSHSRAGAANDLLSWILNPEWLLPLNEILTINT